MSLAFCGDKILPRGIIRFVAVLQEGLELSFELEAVKVGLEYDGEEGHAGREKLRSDRRRHNFLQDDDWAMFYATDLDVYRDFAELMRKIGTAIARRSRRNGISRSQSTTIRP